MIKNKERRDKMADKEEKKENETVEKKETEKVETKENKKEKEMVPKEDYDASRELGSYAYYD